MLLIGKIRENKVFIHSNTACVCELEKNFLSHIYKYILHRKEGKKNREINYIINWIDFDWVGLLI